MNKSCMAIFGVGLLAGCSGSHAFEVDVDGVRGERAELTLYGVTTPMEQSREGFVGRRRNRADGSGRITIYFRDREPVVCPIGYVTIDEDEPHRFVVENGSCRHS